MSSWQDIDTYEFNLWDGDTVMLRDNSTGQELIATWGWDEEDWDNIYGAWHIGFDGYDHLPAGFDPDVWRPLTEEETSKGPDAP